MLLSSHPRPAIVLLPIACALLVLALAPSGAAAAAAGASPPELATEQSYSSYQPAAGSAPPVAAEAYYGSYGRPQALSAPAQPAAASDGTSWVLIALAVAGGLALLSEGAIQARRLALRRRRAVGLPA